MVNFGESSLSGVCQCGEDAVGTFGLCHDCLMEINAEGSEEKRQGPEEEPSRID